MNNKIKGAIFLSGLCLLAVFPGVSARTAAVEGAKENQRMNDILQYISSSWGALTRSMTACNEFLDPKESARPVLYFPAGYAVPADVKTLERNCSISIEHLPQVITGLGEIDLDKVAPPGLLYLEHPYVIPGGRFNEMYGWDSYFILRGLLREGKLDLARGIVENFFFEIDHYGGVLNANRTYYLTRSQPPFLTSMILAVYDSEKAKGQDDPAWLEKAYPYAVKDYRFWTHLPHLAGDTGLSRYFDFGNGPVPEMGDSPGYYREVVRHFLTYPREAGSFLVRSPDPHRIPNTIGPRFPLELCEPDAESTKDCTPVEGVSLSREYYKGDRSMRESGFDVSFRFGPFSAATHHYAGVDLNSLLYKTEKDLERISGILGHKQEAAQWRTRAEKRREAMDKYLWNSQRGLYFDYDFVAHAQSSYVFAATFYPLWAGLASPEQAEAVRQNLKLFEQQGGLAMSGTASGAQWDYPYGWAPIHLIAIEGLRRYGFNEDADRLSYKFLSMVLENFRRDKTIREKYNVVTRSSETHVAEGYPQNVVGFGWTNGVFLELLHALPEPWVKRLHVK
ncbi:MAG: trehalase [Acidobacteriia bacterium]|nr:trehalase [Terriglobia bacterium]